MEHNRFPGLRIVKGTIGTDGKASNNELNDAVEWCDFLLHGSGASMVAYKDVEAFVRHTRNPSASMALSTPVLALRKRN